MELEDIMQESIEILQKDFYSKPFNFSYSSLNKLMWNPQAFYQMYVLGNREEKLDGYLVNGKVIHALLLEEHKFEDQFVISPDNLPTGNPKLVIDRVFIHHQELAANGDTRSTLAEFAPAILDIMKDINYHQSLKTDQQRLDKILTPESENYWNFLKSKGDKTLIDQTTYDFCKTGVDLIKTNNKVCALLGFNINEFEDKEVFNEWPMDCKVVNKPFGLKGIIDNLVFDHDKKIIYINDIKTTSKDLKDFPESIEFYNYWMQAAIYTTMVIVKFMKLINSGYQLKFHFVVIDKAYQVYAFPVKEDTMNNWFERLTEVLNKAEWHYVNKSYDLPYDFAVGKVTL